MKRGAQYMSQDAIRRVHNNYKLRPNYRPTRGETLIILSITALCLYIAMVTR